MNTSSQIFQLRGLFLWSFILTLNLFFYPSLDVYAATDQSSTRVIEKHEPCGFALAVVDHHSNVPYFHHVDSSEDCMGNFVRMLHSLARDIHERKKQFPFYNGSRRSWTKRTLHTVGYAKNHLTASLTPKRA